MNWFKRKKTKASDYAKAWNEIRKTPKIDPPRIVLKSQCGGEARYGVEYDGGLYTERAELKPDDAIKLARWILETFEEEKDCAVNLPKGFRIDLDALEEKK